MEYISPFIVISAVCLLLFFKEMKLGERAAKVIEFFSAVTFDVYLLHDEPLVRGTFIIGAFASYLFMNPGLMILAVIGAALVIWITGSLAGWIRIWIFRLVRVDRFCKWVEERITAAVSAKWQ